MTWHLWTVKNLNGPTNLSTPSVKSQENVGLTLILTRTVSGVVTKNHNELASSCPHRCVLIKIKIM